LDKCRCLTVFWWAWLGNCTSTDWFVENAIFWTYVACRCVGFCQTSFHAIYNKFWFDEADKEGRDNVQDKQKLGGTLDKITFPHFSDRGPARFGEYPATVSPMFAFYGLFALTSLVAAETNMRDLQISPSSAIDSTGQIIALVIALATVFRAAYLFVNLFWHDKARGFVRPFHLRRYIFRSGATYMLGPDSSHSIVALPLGTILKRPTRVTLDYGPDNVLGHIPVPEGNIMRSVVHDWTLKLQSRRSWIQALFGTVPPDSSKLLVADRVETVSFNPGRETLRACTAIPGLGPYLQGGQKLKTVYLVVGLKVATLTGNFTKRADTPQSDTVIDQTLKTARNLGPGERAATHANPSGKLNQQTSHENREGGDLLAFKFHAITIRRDRTVVKDFVFTEGAVL
jgi:hypothetical protein